MTASNDPLLGIVVADRYILLEKVAEGRSGVVYRAEHALLRSRVAVKLLYEQLSRDEQALQDYHQDLTTVARIESDHIARVADFGRTDEGRLFVAMEFLDGETLGSVIAREGRLEEERTIEILEQVGDALFEAHSLGLIHGTLRPKNVFLTRKRRREVAKLLSFGLLRLVEDVSTSLTAERGQSALLDAHYVCPELVRGDVIDARGDVYSLAAVAYTMVCGTPPFEGVDGVDVLRKQAELSPTPLRQRQPALSEGFSAAVQRALARQPEERFPSVGAFLDAVAGRVATMASVGEGHKAASVGEGHKAQSGKRTTQPMTAQDGKAAASSKPEPPKAEPPQPEPPKPEPPKAEPPKAEPPKAEPPKPEPPKAEPPKPEPPKAEPPKPEPPKPEAPKPEAPKPEAPKPEAPKPEVSPSESGDTSAEAGPVEVPSPLLGQQFFDPKARTLMGVGVTTADVQRALELHALGGASSALSGSSGSSPPAEAKPEQVVAAPTSVVQGDDVAELEPGVFSSETMIPEGSSPRSSGNRRKTPVPDTSDLIGTDQIPTESGDWFAEGMAAEQALETGTSGSSLPAMYGEVDELDDVRHGPSPSLIIGLVVVLAIAVLAIIYFATRGGEDTEQQRLTKRIMPAQGGVDELGATGGAVAQPEPTLAPATSDAGSDAGQQPQDPALDGGEAEGPPDATVMASAVADAQASVDTSPESAGEKTVAAKKEVERTPSSRRPKRTPPRRAKKKRKDKPRRSTRASVDESKTQNADRRAEASRQVELARAQLRRGSYGRAKELFQAALKLDSRNAQAQGGLGEVHFELGNYVQSARHLKRAVAMSPSSSRYRVMLGNVYFKQGRTNAAISQYRQALRLNPNSAAARTGLRAAIRRIANEG